MDSYGLELVYSDGVTETLKATVTTVLDTFSLNLYEVTTGVSATPLLPTHPPVVTSISSG